MPGAQLRFALLLYVRRDGDATRLRARMFAPLGGVLEDPGDRQRLRRPGRVADRHGAWRKRRPALRDRAGRGNGPAQFADRFGAEDGGGAGGGDRRRKLCSGRPRHAGGLNRSCPARPYRDGVASPLRLWILLGAAFLTFAVGAACMHAYTVFLIAFIEAFGWSRAQVSIAYSVVAVDQRCHVAAGRHAGGPVRAAAAGPDRRLSCSRRPARQFVRQRAVADDRAVRRGDDTGRQLSGAGGVRADAVAPFRAQSRHGGGRRAVGQRLRPRLLGAAVSRC